MSLGDRGPLPPRLFVLFFFPTTFERRAVPPTEPPIGSAPCCRTDRVLVQAIGTIQSYRVLLISQANSSEESKIP